MMRIKSWSFGLIGLFCLVQSALAVDLSAYKPDAGSYEITSQALMVFVPDQDRHMRVRLTYPAEAPGPFPVVIFSHGGGRAEFIPNYRLFTDHWASHGYVVLQPLHLDAELSAADFGKMMQQSKGGPDPLMASRLSDVTFLVEHLSALEWGIPGLAGKFDQNHIAVAGHSKGSATAFVAGGGVLEDPRNGTLLAASPQNFDAILFLSEPGNAAFMPRQPWRAITETPLLVTTGTNDFGAVANRNMGFRYRTIPQGPPSGLKHYLYIDDLDQHFGGLVSGKDTRGTGPDKEALAIVRGISTAFLDAHTKEDWAALEFMLSDKVQEATGPRARIVE